ncbi:MAG: Homoserine dehydrogenase [Elusimicrobia bacterium ADurb.Bin231]|nr:MAG: Homoserine dehydrogenase [Elusimicrobia bacterium ADurb.Bin231]
MINIGIIGCGTVGSTVINILDKNSSIIRKRVGCEINIKKVCDKDLSRIRESGLPEKCITDDYMSVLNDPEIDIVVELIGGKTLANDIVLNSIEKGKSVVTANKALISENWDKIFSAALSKKVLVYFEASVGAGIPVIQALHEGLAANRIQSIVGILNGTTNFILTKMTDENMSFEAALKTACKLGFAEADPSLDIDGSDAAQKLSILASISFGSHISVNKIYKEGISRVSPLDIKYARDKFGFVLKLLAIVKTEDKRIFAAVYPAFVSTEHPLSTVENEYNAVYINGDSVGDIMLYGKGAGGGSAASAVVADIIDLSRNIYYGTAGKFPYVLYDKRMKTKIQDISKMNSKYYIRFSTVDRPGVLSKISGILGKRHVSISSCFQEERQRGQSVPILMLTHLAKEGDVKRAIKEIDDLDIIKSKTVVLRIVE